MDGGKKIVVSWYHDPLPTTSNSQAEACYNAAKDAGLERVKLGNVFLLDAMI